MLTCMSNFTTYDGTTLIMTTEKSFKYETMLKFTQFSNFKRFMKISILQIAAQAFEAEDSFKIFLRFWGF